MLARNVRRLREARGRSQVALAADARIDQELVSEIENGAANPELDTLGRIAEALGCEPRDLFEEWSPSPLYAPSTQSPFAKNADKAAIERALKEIELGAVLVRNRGAKNERSPERV